MDFVTNLFTTAMLFLYQFLGQNIILTIIIFTLLIRLATFPLTQAQMRSSKQMQEMQPKMKKLQEKYKNDREKLAQEQMKLYRENGVNPLMGCLPLVVQLPILLGLYGAISHTLSATPLQLVDLQSRLLVPSLAEMLPLQNHFAWLNLALPDPFFFLPILVVASTWLQSKLMTPPPTSNDPNDPSAAVARNMTVMMPLMIGFFSLNFASGLSIYWIISNVFGILQYIALGKVDWATVFGRQPALAGATVADTANVKNADVVAEVKQRKSNAAVFIENDYGASADARKATTENDAAAKKRATSAAVRKAQAKRNR